MRLHPASQQYLCNDSITRPARREWNLLIRVWQTKTTSAVCLSRCTAAFWIVWECSHHAEGTPGDPGFGIAEKLSGMRTALSWNASGKCSMQIKGACNLWAGSSLIRMVKGTHVAGCTSVGGCWRQLEPGQSIREEGWAGEVDGVENWLIASLRKTGGQQKAEWRKKGPLRSTLNLVLGSHLDQEDGSLPAAAGEPRKPGARPWEVPWSLCPVVSGMTFFSTAVLLWAMRQSPVSVSAKAFSEHSQGSTTPDPAEVE